MVCIQPSVRPSVKAVFWENRILLQEPVGRKLRLEMFGILKKTLTGLLNLTAAAIMLLSNLHMDYTAITGANSGRQLHLHINISCVAHCSPLDAVLGRRLVLRKQEEVVYHVRDSARRGVHYQE